MFKLGFTQEVYLNDLKGALENYQYFLDHTQDPIRRYEVRKRMANLYYEQRQDLDRAIEIYTTLIGENSDSLEKDFFLFRIAQSEFQLNQFEKSRKHFQELLSEFPKTTYLARARFQIGNSYYMEGKYKIAIDAFKQVLRENGQSEYAMEAQFLLAECLDQLGEKDQALETYKNLEGRYSPSEILKERIENLKKRIERKAG